MLSFVASVVAELRMFELKPKVGGILKPIKETKMATVTLSYKKRLIEKILNDLKRESFAYLKGSNSCFDLWSNTVAIKKWLAFLLQRQK